MRPAERRESVMSEPEKRLLGRGQSKYRVLEAGKVLAISKSRKEPYLA